MTVFDLVKNVCVSLKNDYYGIIVYSRCMFADSDEQENSIKEEYSKLVFEYRDNFSDKDVVNLNKFSTLDVTRCVCTDLEGDENYPVYSIHTKLGVLLFTPEDAKPSVHLDSQDSVKVRRTVSCKDSKVKCKNTFLTISVLKSLLDSTDSQFKVECDV